MKLNLRLAWLTAFLAASLWNTSNASSPDTELLVRTSHAFNEAAQKTLPSVVSISAIKQEPLAAYLNPAEPDSSKKPPGGLPDADEPLRSSPRSPREGVPNSPEDPYFYGIGSGIIVRPNGIILTNNHVVEGVQKVTVHFDEKHKDTAHVLGTDPKTDLAIVQLDHPQHELPVASFGDSEKVKIGDWAIAVGSPFGLNRTVTFGMISAKGRSQMKVLDIEDFIQTDAAINPGSSGGPLLNSNGDVIGINTAIFSQSGNFAGVGFAIPSSIARDVADEMIAHGHVIRGWIGVAAQNMDEDLSQYFKVPSSEGALITQVLSSGPAGAARIKTGDVLVSYGDKRVKDADELKSRVAKSKVNTVMPVKYVRDGRTYSASIRILEAPFPPNERRHEMAGQAVMGSQKKKPSLGISIQDTPEEIADIIKLPSSNAGAFVMKVQPESAAFDAGLEPGDIILKANNEAIHHAKDFTQVARTMKPHDLAVLYVFRAPNEKIFVPLRFPG